MFTKLCFLLYVWVDVYFIVSGKCLNSSSAFYLLQSDLNFSVFVPRALSLTQNGNIVLLFYFPIFRYPFLCSFIRRGCGCQCEYVFGLEYSFEYNLIFIGLVSAAEFQMKFSSSDFVFFLHSGFIFKQRARNQEKSQHKSCGF